jgi:hypothetical protein
MSDNDLKDVPAAQLVRISIGAMAELATRELNKLPLDERLIVAEMIEADAFLKVSIDFEAATLDFFLNRDGESHYLFTLAAAPREERAAEERLH